MPGFIFERIDFNFVLLRIIIIRLTLGKYRSANPRGAAY